MTVSSTTARNQYTGDGTVATYPYTFRAFDATDLLVVKKDTSGNETLLNYGTDYTVTGAGSYSGGTITLTAGNLTTGYTLSIRRILDLLQSTDLRNQGSFLAEVHERVFDRLVMIAQQQQDELDRSMKFPESDASAQLLPTKEQRANKALSFDANGDPTASASPASGTISAPMQPVTSAASLKAARNAFGPEFHVIGTDANAIQAAADAAYAAGGGTVVLSQGTYSVTSVVTLRARVKLRGQGLGATDISLTSAGRLVWSEASLSDINGGGMYDVTVRCDINGTAITAQNIWGWFCHRCHIWGQGQLLTAISLQGYSFECDIRNCRITDYNTSGIAFSDYLGNAVYPNATIIKGNDFAGNNGATNIVVNGAGAVRICENYFERAYHDSGVCISATNCTTLCVSNNSINASYGVESQIVLGAGTKMARILDNHISVSGYVTGATRGIGITMTGSGTAFNSIIGNTFEVDSASDVIIIDGSYGVTISSNTVRMVDSGYEGATGSIIDLKNTATQVTLTGNMLMATGGTMLGNGIKIANGCADITITGGVISGMTTGINCLCAGASKVVTVSGVALSANATQVVITAATAITIRDCPGFKTAGYGTGTITSGTTSASVAHGLSITPASSSVNVQCYGSSTNKPRQIWVNATSATNITVNCDADPGASGLAFTWSVQPE